MIPSFPHIITRILVLWKLAVCMCDKKTAVMDINTVLLLNVFTLLK